MSLDLLFLDGFDLCQSNTFTLKYNVSIPFLQARVVPGRGSPGAIRIENTSGNTDTFSRTVGASPVLFWAADIANQFSAFAQHTFLILGTASGPTPLLQLQVQVDGTLRLLDGSGSLLGASTAAMSLNTWYFLEVNAVYGTSGSYEVWLEGVKIISGTANLTSAIPDTFTLSINSSGWFFTIDNLQVFSGAALSDRNGPARVTSLIANAVANTGGWNFGGANATSLIQSVADSPTGIYTSAPDGDLSYAHPGVSTFSVLMATSPCYGLVLGVALNQCAKPTSGSTSLTATVNERTGAYVIGIASVVDTGSALVPGLPDLYGFATYQAIAQFNEAGSNWNDLQISTAQWGAEAGGPLELTQVYLEKLVDLTGKKYGCGESSYSF